MSVDEAPGMKCMCSMTTGSSTRETFVRVHRGWHYRLTALAAALSAFEAAVAAAPVTSGTEGGGTSIEFSSYTLRRSEDSFRVDGSLASGAIGARALGNATDDQAPIEHLLSTPTGEAAVYSTLGVVLCFVLGLSVAFVRTCKTETDPRDPRRDIVVNEYFSCLVLTFWLLLGPAVVFVVGLVQMFGKGNTVETAVALTGVGLVVIFFVLWYSGHRTFEINAHEQYFVLTTRRLIAWPTRSFIPLQEIECFALQTKMRNNKVLTRVQANVVGGRCLPLDSNYTTRPARERQALCNRLNDALRRAQRASVSSAAESYASARGGNTGSGSTNGSSVIAMVDPLVAAADAAMRAESAQAASARAGPGEGLDEPLLSSEDSDPTMRRAAVRPVA